MNNWEEIVESVREKAQAMHEAREAGLAKCRILIQTSAKCIRNVHRHQFDEAEKLLAQAKQISVDARTALRPYGELFYAGYLHDAEKEMVEAAAVLAIVHGKDLPSPEFLDVMPMTYLNGLGEAASECRRFALDELRKGKVAEAERILLQMETIYDDLITFDFPDSLTSGLRRTCDALRAVIERTRSDLTTTVGQRDLIEELRATREKLA